MRTKFLLAVIYWSPLRNLISYKTLEKTEKIEIQFLDVLNYLKLQCMLSKFGMDIFNSLKIM